MVFGPYDKIKSFTAKVAKKCRKVRKGILNPAYLARRNVFAPAFMF
jgi:hypothetical protein